MVVHSGFEHRRVPRGRMRQRARRLEGGRISLGRSVSCNLESEMGACAREGMGGQNRCRARPAGRSDTASVRGFGGHLHHVHSRTCPFSLYAIPGRAAVGLLIAAVLALHRALAARGQREPLFPPAGQRGGRGLFGRDPQHRRHRFASAARRGGDQGDGRSSGFTKDLRRRRGAVDLRVALARRHSRSAALWWWGERAGERTLGR